MLNPRVATYPGLLYHDSRRAQEKETSTQAEDKLQGFFRTRAWSTNALKDTSSTRTPTPPFHHPTHFTIRPKAHFHTPPTFTDPPSTMAHDICPPAERLSTDTAGVAA